MAKKSKRQQAFDLFRSGKRPADPECKALGLKGHTLYNYHQLFKKNGTTSEDYPESATPVNPTEVVTPPATPTIGPGQLMTVVPRSFQVVSSLFWQAKEACQREWGWNPEMSPAQFLDTFLFLAMQQRGIILGGYAVVPEKQEVVPDNGEEVANAG